MLTLYGKDGSVKKVKNPVDYKEILAQKDGFYSAEPKAESKIIKEEVKVEAPAPDVQEEEKPKTRGRKPSAKAE